MTKRFLAMVVSVLMVAALLPMAVFADDPVWGVDAVKVSLLPAENLVENMHGAAKSNQNKLESENDSIKVSKVGDTVNVTISGSLRELLTYNSGNIQGSHKWIGLVVKTGLELFGENADNVGYLSVKDEEPYQFGEADAAENAAFGITDTDAFILWVKADEIVDEPITRWIQLYKDPAENNAELVKEVELNVRFVDTTPLNVSVDKLNPNNIPKEWKNIGYEDKLDHAEEAIANLRKVSVKQEGNVVTITGHLNELAKFESSDPSQGSHKWIALVVDTGVKDFAGVEYLTNETAEPQALDSEDMLKDILADNISVGVDEKGSTSTSKVVLWVKADEIAKEPKTPIFRQVDTQDKVIYEVPLTIKFMDIPYVTPGVSLPTTPQTVPASGTPGVVVSGNLSAGATVTATPATMDTVAPAAAAQFAVALAGGEKTLLSITDVKLNGTFSGTLSVTLPVDPQYNGQTVTVLHYTSAGKLETYTAVVVNGTVTVNVTSLSPFAVLIDSNLVVEEGSDLEEGTTEDDLPDEDIGDIEDITEDIEEDEEPAKTGDFASGYAMVIASNIVAAAAMAFVSKKARNN